MAKELYFAELFEQYEKLLNPHRRKIAYEYYILDLSLGEIAEGNGVSRQSVNDALRKTKEQLSELENALHLAKREASLAEFGERLKAENERLYREFIRILKD